MQENALIRSIEEEYRKAFLYINKGLNADENGYKEDARNFYRQGQEHLLRGLGVSLQSPEYIGPAWDSARQMQVKMQETLENVNTRLNILKQGMMGRVPEPRAALAPQYPSLPAAQKERPGRPPLPTMPPFPAEPVSGIACVPTNNPTPLNPFTEGAVAPPAYTPQATDGHYCVSYGTDSGEHSIVGDDFYSMTAQPPPVQSLGVDAEELVLIPRGVQIFFVTPDGDVSAPSYPGYLRIIKFMDTSSEMAQTRPPAFLQVCDWLYPLMCTQSPVLRSNVGVYMFPDLMSQAPGSYVGVVLSAELPAADLELFEDLLKQMSDLRIQPSEALGEVIDLSQTVHVTIPEAEPEPKEKDDLPPWSEKVAHGILQGASWLNWGLVKGAELTEKAIHKGATKLREHIQPEDRPMEVNPTVAKGLHVAKQATGGAVKVSQFLVDGVCAIASCVGRELGPHVKKHGSKLIPESLKKDKDGKSPLDGAMVVAASGVQGFATVWQGLEYAGKNVAKSVATETVHTVKYKYGKEAGYATHDAVNSAINVGVTAFNIDHLGIKAIVKKTAKETSHAILDEYKLSEKQTKKGEPH
ncbi:PREDICTED: spartin isoform X1 [Nanorana parkeri]|uniref:spartin isoform X1 n=1 Tax=Nanorana parkeri TaxID=125878 RepID=UPI000854C0C9|nr:PREDICTED: spartin isoform X1 [Nanorana parkeri]